MTYKYLRFIEIRLAYATAFLFFLFIFPSRVPTLCLSQRLLKSVTDTCSARSSETFTLTGTQLLTGNIDLLLSLLFVLCGPW